MTEMFRYLIGILEKEERREWKILLILNVINPVLNLFNFSAIIYIINLIIQEKTVSKEIIIFTFFMAIISIGKGFFDINKCKIQNQFIYDGAQKLSVKLYRLLVKENLIDHGKRTPMQAVALVRSDTLNCMNILVNGIDILSNILMMTGYYAVIIYISKWIGLISCVIFTFLMVRSFLHHRSRIKNYGEKSRVYAIKANAQITIAFGNFKEMKIADKSIRMLDKYRNVNEKYTQMQKEYQYSKSIISMIMQNLVMAAIFAAFGCFLINPLDNIAIVLMSMAVYFTLLIKMIPKANSIVSGLISVEFLRKSYDTVREELAEYVHMEKEEEGTSETREKKLSFQKGLLVKGLTFGYNSHIKIFNDASIEIPAGYAVAIIGASGIGKTTFLDLILGLLKPQAGEILYDDYDIAIQTDKEGKCRASIGDIVSYISQTVYLNGETVRNNVAFFEEEEDIDEYKVIECLKCAQIWEDVKQMPEGINTLIGENGFSLSGGQRQRIALARALYKDFEILIMDEVTAALDAETEKAVIDSIKQVKKNKTILIATHHMSLANECDMIYKIEDQGFIRLK